MMFSEPAVVTYTLSEPYEAALARVRSALHKHGLRTAMELDVAGRIRSELGAGVAPCTVIYVDDPAVLLEAAVFHRGAALLIPQPVVVTGDQWQSEALVRNMDVRHGGIPESVRDPFADLQRRITLSMESIAEPHTAPLASIA